MRDRAFAHLHQAKMNDETHGFPTNLGVHPWSGRNTW